MLRLYRTSVDLRHFRLRCEMSRDYLSMVFLRLVKFKHPGLRDRRIKRVNDHKIFCVFSV